jgi:hypothetical protein
LVARAESALRAGDVSEAERLWREAVATDIAVPLLDVLFRRGPLRVLDRPTALPSSAAHRAVEQARARGSAHAWIAYDASGLVAAGDSRRAVLEMAGDRAVVLLATER